MSASDRVQSSTPRVLLPAGITTAPRPRIEWKPIQGAAVWQVRVRTPDSTDCPLGPCWESKEISSDASYVVPDVDLPSHMSLYVEARAKFGNSWTPWGLPSAFKVEPVCPLQGGIVVYDLHYTRQLSPLQSFAHTHLVSTLQGLVNRHQPSLYVRFVQAHADYLTPGLPHADIDQFWLDRLRAEDGWLGEVVIRRIDNLPDLLELYGDWINGLVVWDTSLPATSNIASTVAGADSLLPVPCCSEASSLFRELTLDFGLPIKVDLRGKFTGSGTIPDTERASTGSRKCDAYLWAVENYLLTGRCDPAWMGYYLDAWWVRDPSPGGNWQNHTLINHDYFVSRRGFFWDLNVWNDESPVDDTSQSPGTDLQVLKEIFAAANHVLNNRSMIHVGGFVPWSFKYTNHPGAGGTHEPVATEWELTRILSAYNAYIDADALGLGAMANASFLHHFPLPGYAPVLAYTPEEMRAAGLLTEHNKPTEKDFLLNYVGDYDSAAWVWNTLSLIWESPERGQLPLAWAVNPNLADRAAPFFEFMYRTRTANDHFITGDSGAGYINPTQVFSPRDPSNLPDGSDNWQRHSVRWYRRFGLRFTGFLINGLAGPITASAERMYLGLSPDGIVNQYGRSPDKLHEVGNSMPVFELLADIHNVKEGIGQIRGKAMEMGTRPRFMVFRQILKSPQWYMDLLDGLAVPGTGLMIEFCDPHTFSGLAKAHLGIDNSDQYSLLINGIPAQGTSGNTVTGDVAVRNDGWNTWMPTEHQLLLEIVQSSSGNRIWQKAIELPKAVEPGESIVIPLQVTLPDFAGNYDLEMDMARDGVRFSAKAGYSIKQQLIVKKAQVSPTVKPALVP